MLAILGILLVFAAVIGGFLMERGNPWVLMQPAELLIICGAGAGIVLVSNSPAGIRKMLRGFSAFFTRASVTPNHSSNISGCCMSCSCIRSGPAESCKSSRMSKSGQSPIFFRYPEFLRDRETCSFVCDSLRMLVIGVTLPHELSELMELDIEIQRRGRHEPSNALSAVAEALPGLGIVAAVLGVVITMEAIGGAPETIGQKVAAALVGTFLGILLCYGVVGPLASRLESLTEAHAQFLQVLRIAIVAFARGSSPMLAIEYARRSIPVELRPSFIEMETTLRRDARIPAIAKSDGGASGEAQDAVVQSA